MHKSAIKNVTSSDCLMFVIKKRVLVTLGFKRASFTM